jgi:alginate O-acetyltransferase complex protein AlgI
MVFSSSIFLFAFLPIFLFSQCFFPLRNVSFVILSLLFYFFGEGWFTVLVIALIGVNFAFGIAIDISPTPAVRRLWLGIAVGCDLLVLLTFKYLAFLSTSLFGPLPDSWSQSIHLPLGISFLAFHSISYVIDIYRAKARAERSIVNLALYIAMFPQLIAGPIIRYSTIASQLRRRVVTSRHVYYGLSTFAFGLGQKVLIADTLARMVDPLFATWQTLSAATTWLCVAGYAFQIYFDFSGYSTMAIGLAMASGFRFPRNFDHPYVSRSITEFWRRWHISLSRWFRDYLYIPLGGNRHGAARTYLNLFMVFILCGLWHGAAWTFVAWGIYHGLLLVLERLGLGRILERLPVAFGHVYALVAIMIGWVLFRSESLHQAAEIVGRMALLRPAGTVVPVEVLTGEYLAALLAATLFSFPQVGTWIGPCLAIPAEERRVCRRMPGRAYAAGIVVAGAVFGMSLLRILTGAYSPFIYFRF